MELLDQRAYVLPKHFMEGVEAIVPSWAFAPEASSDGSWPGRGMFRIRHERRLHLGSGTLLVHGPLVW